MNPSEAQVEEALQSVKNATQAAEAAQAAPSLLESLEGPSVFALATADAQLLVAEIQTVTAINAENDAYAEEMHAIGVMNQVLLAHPRPFPLAGRYTGGRPPNAGGGGDDDDECRKEWEEAYERCRGLIANNGPIRLRGSKGGRPYTNVEDCASGFVSERCGGNPIDWGKLK